MVNGQPDGEVETADKDVALAAESETTVGVQTSLVPKCGTPLSDDRRGRADSAACYPLEALPETA